MNKLYSLFVVLFFCIKPESVLSQIKIDSTSESRNIYLAPLLQPVLIQYIQVFKTENSTFLNTDQIQNSGALSLSDAIAKQPGMSQLTTGAGISKPVIRGLFGNRIQVNVMGLRFDSQQWQDEHGLGLTDIGVSNVELLKGAAALQYGSEAIGGVINIIDESNCPTGKPIEQDLRTKLNSNTLGFGISYSRKKEMANGCWRINIAAENNGDYSSSRNTRVLNSRFDNYFIKISKSRKNKKWSGENNFYSGINRTGFVFDSISRKAEDGRFSRTFDGPHHSVFFALAGITRSRAKEDNSVQTYKVGVISNLRQEQEEGNRISLNMLLNTFSMSTGISNKRLNKGWFNYGINVMAQSNQNFGVRIIIPNAFVFEGGLYGSYQKWLMRNKLFLNTGVRYDNRTIATFFTDNLLNNGMPAFTKNKSSVNGSINLSRSLFSKPKSRLSASLFISSGFRSGNLAELSSNGLHEGTARWEVGNPDLKLEKNIMSDFNLDYTFKNNWFISASVYNNHFFNYIYLNPTNANYYGFVIYNYVQSDAALNGGELNIKFDNPTAPIVWLSQLSIIDAQKKDGSYLPFIPPYKLYHEIKWKKKTGELLHEYYATIGLTQVMKQNHPSEFETSTSGYNLINASVGKKWKSASSFQTYSVSIIGTNLTDKKYFDHLSRFKYYGIYNMGRNIVLNFSINF